MQVHKLFSSSTKQLTLKPKYQKPVYKSYRELLQLDRPRKQIDYESSQSEEDFLEKLMNEQKLKSKNKKKKSRKSSRQSTRPKAQKAKVVEVAKKKEEEQVEEKKPRNKFMDQIEAFLSENKQVQGQDINEEQPKIQQKKVNPMPKTAKSKTSSNTKNFQRYDKSKQLQRKDVLLNNPIFIDTKSVLSPPIVFSSANHIFTSTLGIKQQLAYEHLISMKQMYQKKYSQDINPLSDHFSKTGEIKHTLRRSGEQNFTYRPNIEPLNPNWRINLTINPLANKEKRQFPDRKVMFRSQQEQQRFIRSLSQFRSIK